MNQITIDEKKLEGIFAHLKVVKNLRDRYIDKDEIAYEKYLGEFIGIYVTLVVLDLEDRWREWQIQHWND